MTEQAQGQRGSPNPDQWQVYLLECADGTYYCGITRNVQRRLRQHNGLCAGGARYTAARRPVALVALARLLGHGNALRLEAAIRKLPRHKKIAALEKYGQCQDWK